MAHKKRRLSGITGGEIHQSRAKALIACEKFSRNPNDCKHGVALLMDEMQSATNYTGLDGRRKKRRR